MLTLAFLRKELKSKANPRKAQILQGFFKTGKGEYGEGDIFLGITVPESRKIVQRYGSLGLEDLGALLTENLIAQLTKLREINPSALLEYPDENFTEENKTARYYERNSKIIEASDELIAFRVKTEASPGAGTSDTIEKAKIKGTPVKLFEWDLTKRKGGV